MQNSDAWKSQFGLKSSKLCGIYSIAEPHIFYVDAVPAPGKKSIVNKVPILLINVIFKNQTIACLAALARGQEYYSCSFELRPCCPQLRSIGFTFYLLF
jgi:hypothetical protein